MSQNKRWLHISFSIPSGVEVAAFENLFNKAQDWIKYNRNCWLIYTGADMEVWNNRIQRIPGMDGASVFIVPFEPANATGYLPNWMWERLYEKD